MFSQLCHLSGIAVSDPEYVIPAPRGWRAMSVLKLTRLGINHAVGNGPDR